MIHSLFRNWQVTVKQQQNGWMQVANAGGQTGWVPSSFVLTEQIDKAIPAQMRIVSGKPFPMEFAYSVKHIGDGLHHHATFSGTTRPCNVIHVVWTWPTRIGLRQCKLSI